MTTISSLNHDSGLLNRRRHWAQLSATALSEQMQRDLEPNMYIRRGRHDTRRCKTCVTYGVLVVVCETQEVVKYEPGSRIGRTVEKPKKNAGFFLYTTDSTACE